MAKRSWSTPSFDVEETSGALTFRRKKGLSIAPWVWTLLLDAVVVGAALLVVVDRVTVIVVDALAGIGFIVSAVADAERRSIASIRRVVRRSLELHRRRAEASEYREAVEARHWLVLDGERIEGSADDRVVVAERRYPRRGAEPRSEFVVCIVAPPRVVELDALGDHTQALRLAGHLQNALGNGHTTRTHDASLGFEAGALFVLLLLALVAACIGIPFALVGTLDKAAPSSVALRASFVAALCLVGSDLLVRNTLVFLVRSRIRRAYARIFDLPA